MLLCDLREGDFCFPCSSLLEKFRRVCGKRQKAVWRQGAARPSLDVALSPRIPGHGAGLWPTFLWQRAAPAGSCCGGYKKGNASLRSPMSELAVPGRCGERGGCWHRTDVPHRAGGTCPTEPGQPARCWSWAAGRVGLRQLAVR